MRVAVIGAGWAGCAAAVTLARLGHAVRMHEAAAVPGGRARRVARDGLPVDNGQHLLLGAYAQTRNLLAVVHGGDGERGLLHRRPLALAPLARQAVALQAWRLPAPLGLAAGLLGARGLRLSDRLGAAAWFARLARRGFRVAAGTTVAALTADGPPAAADALWSPLCLAALNTPPERACAQVYANVLKASFGEGDAASDFLVPATDLGALFPDAALRFVAGHGGEARLRSPARLAAVDEARVTVAAGGTHEDFDAVVLAVGPHQLAGAAGDVPALREARDAAGSLAWEPIATAWLGYAAPVALPAPVVRLDDAPGQWAFDRPDVLARAAASDGRPAIASLLAVVVSAGGPHEALPADALARACDAQLRRLAPALPALAWSQAITERRATYACVPGRARPARQPHPRVVLAGDWIDADYPATLEAAVRTGVAAAFALDDRTATGA